MVSIAQEISTRRREQKANQNVQKLQRRRGGVGSIIVSTAAIVVAIILMIRNSTNIRRIIKCTKNDDLLPASSSFDISAANRTLHLAWAAFCDEASLRAWDCQWCDNGNNSDDEKDSSQQQQRPLVDLHAYLHNDQAGTAGYVAVDAARHTVVVSYRGSDDLANVKEDAEFWLVNPPFGPTAAPSSSKSTGSEQQQVQVEAGFLSAYLSLRNATEEALKGALHKCDGSSSSNLEKVEGSRSTNFNRRSSCELLFTGHSLGAAMATMAAAEIGASFVRRPVRLVTFGSPRVGNQAFANWAHRQILDSHHSKEDHHSNTSITNVNTATATRITVAVPTNDYSLLPISMRMRRQLDVVPAIPPRYLGFAHLPSEVWNVHTRGSSWDSTSDAYVLCDDDGDSGNDHEKDQEEDPNCGISEEHPPFPLDLFHLRPAEHTRYMGYEGGNCNNNNNNYDNHRRNNGK